jgi:hypothetical protein
MGKDYNKLKDSFKGDDLPVGMMGDMWQGYEGSRIRKSARNQKGQARNNPKSGRHAPWRDLPILRRDFSTRHSPLPVSSAVQ